MGAAFGLGAPERRAIVAASALLMLALAAFGIVDEGFIADHDVLPFGLAALDEPAALRAYQRLAPGAPIEERAAAARRLARAAPVDAQSLNALSYIAFVRGGGRMTEPALAALTRSYAVAPYDAPSAVWRIAYALENWSALSRDLRVKVLAQAQTVATDPTLGPELRIRLKAVHDPAGALAAAMILRDDEPRQTIQPGQD
jgi:hypothetical protein